MKVSLTDINFEVPMEIEEHLLNIAEKTVRKALVLDNSETVNAVILKRKFAIGFHNGWNCINSGKLNLPNNLNNEMIILP